MYYAIFSMRLRTYSSRYYLILLLNTLNLSYMDAPTMIADCLK